MGRSTPDRLGRTNQSSPTPETANSATSGNSSNSQAAAAGLTQPAATVVDAVTSQETQSAVLALSEQVASVGPASQTSAVVKPDDPLQNLSASSDANTLTGNSVQSGNPAQQQQQVLEIKPELKPEPEPSPISVSKER